MTRATRYLRRATGDARRSRGAVILVALLIAGAGAVAFGQLRDQDFIGGRRERYVEPTGNQPYDGRLTFVRLSYPLGIAGFGPFGRREPPWAHDYPTADTHMMKILHELTLARPRLDGSNVMSLSDPDMFNHPIVYMSEPGFWSADEEETKGLRNYLAKGGFIIFDDFRAPEDWNNLQDQMRRVMPEGQWVEIDASSPIFHSFFEINDPESMIPPYGNLAPAFFAMFEGNDRNRRILAIANVNNDLGEYWEFSDTGYAPVDLSNEAYKFGVNYFVYGLTH